MERLIVFALVYLLPTQLAYHFWLQSSYIYGIRVDYLSPAIYLTDFLFILLLPYLIKRIDFKKIKKRLFLSFTILACVFLNIVSSQIPIAALLKWLVVIKLVLFAFYIYFCDLKKLKHTIVFALTLSLITFILIGLVQFVLQKTIGGPLYLLGERNFTFLTPGISLMSLFGKNLMRAYSTFSHPNSFAGFVVVSFIILLSFYSKNKIHVFKKLYILFILAILSLFLTLSLNAILGVVFVTGLYMLLNKFPKAVIKLKTLLPSILIGLSLLFGVCSLVLPKGPALNGSNMERIVLAGKAIETFSNKPLFGIGLNNFFYVSKSTQPVHNIYLIILSEFGIVGTLLLFILLTKLLNRNLNIFLFLGIMFILLTGLFDHYWFTLQQNQLLLALLLGLSLRKYNAKEV